MNYEVLKAKALEYARTNTSETTEEQTAAEISSALTILEKAGISLPPVDDSYEQALYANYKELTAYGKTPEIFNRYKQNLKIVRSFFEWLRKENITMKEDINQTTTGTQSKRTGRPPLDTSGQTRDTKLTVYLTRATYEDLCDLSRLNKKSISSYLMDTIGKESKKHADALKTFRELTSGMDD